MFDSSIYFIFHRVGYIFFTYLNQFLSISFQSYEFCTIKCLKPKSFNLQSRINAVFTNLHWHWPFSLHYELCVGFLSPVHWRASASTPISRWAPGTITHGWVPYNSPRRSVPCSQASREHVIRSGTLYWRTSTWWVVRRWSASSRTVVTTSVTVKVSADWCTAWRGVGRSSGRWGASAGWWRT